MKLDSISWGLVSVALITLVVALFVHNKILKLALFAWEVVP